MSTHSWFVPRSTDFAVREWDAHGVLYDMASGDTHRLGALHLELLELLQQGPGTVEALLQSLQGDLCSQLDLPAQRQQIADALAELARLQLIESAA